MIKMIQCPRSPVPNLENPVSKTLLSEDEFFQLTLFTATSLQVRKLLLSHFPALKCVPEYLCIWMGRLDWLRLN